MRYGCCALLILLGVATGALAQGFGLGFGLDDIRRQKVGTPSPPPVGTKLLIDTGSVMLIDTGSAILIQ